MQIHFVLVIQPNLKKLIPFLQLTTFGPQIFGVACLLLSSKSLLPQETHAIVTDTKDLQSWCKLNPVTFYEQATCSCGVTCATMRL